MINLVSNKPHYENVPFEIPESWEWVMVQDIFELNPKNKVTDEITAGFIPMELVSAGFGFEHSYTTQEWGKIKKGYSHFQNGDIGIAKISPCFENRKSTIFYNLPNNIGAGTTELVVLRGHIVFTKFFLYLFQTAWYISEGTKYFKGVVGQQRVHKDIFTTLNIPLPPLAEQQRIVAEVEKWFALIDELEANKEDLRDNIKQVKSKVLDLAIHGKLVPQDPNDEPAIELLKRIKPNFKPCDTSHYENLPQGWSVCGIKDIAKTISSRQYQILQSEIYNKGAYPVVSQSANYIEGYSNLKDKVLEHKQPVIVFGDHTRVVKYIAFDFIVGADGVKILLPNINSKYFYYLILNASENIKNRGYGRHFGLLSKEEYLIPPLKEQHRIVSMLETIELQLDTISAEL